MTTKQKLVEKLQFEIKQAQHRLAIVEAVPGLENIDVDASFCGDKIDFDNLPHAKIIEVVKALNSGKWSKTPAENGTVNYTTTVGEVDSRCWQGEPPPNCKIVEYLEEVPEQIIPAKVVTKRKLVCT
jgi:hypothetical protein